MAFIHTGADGEKRDLFSKCPPEIRTKILGYVARSEPSQARHLFHVSTKRLLTPTALYKLPAITRVNRDIRKIVVPMLYGDPKHPVWAVVDDFPLNGDAKDGSPLPTLISKSLILSQFERITIYLTWLSEATLHSLTDFTMLFAREDCFATENRVSKQEEKLKQVLKEAGEEESPAPPWTTAEKQCSLDQPCKRSDGDDVGCAVPIREARLPRMMLVRLVDGHVGADLQDEDEMEFMTELTLIGRRFARMRRTKREDIMGEVYAWVICPHNTGESNMRIKGNVVDQWTRKCGGELTFKKLKKLEGYEEGKEELW